MSNMFKALLFLLLLVSVLGIGCSHNHSTQPAPAFEVTGFAYIRIDSTTIKLIWNPVYSADTLSVVRGWGSRTPVDTIAQMLGVWNSFTDYGVRTDSSYCYRLVAKQGTNIALSPVLTISSFASLPHYYLSNILPILTQHCESCHGLNASSGGWRVEGLTAALQNHTLSSYCGNSGTPLVMPDSAMGSQLFIRISQPAGSNIVMPPNSEHLTNAQITLLYQWIQNGANQ